MLLTWQKGLKVLRWGNYPGLAQWAQHNRNSPYGGRRVREGNLMTGTERGVMAKNQRMLADFGSQKMQGIDSPLKPQ